MKTTLSALLSAVLGLCAVEGVAQTSPFAEVKKFSRGIGTEPTYKAFVLPLDGQMGVRLDGTGNTPSKFSSVPWVHRIPESVFYQLFFDGNQAAYTPETNPIAAFGGAVGGSPLYTGRPYRFGAYAGSRSQGGPYNQPVAFFIYAYHKSDFSGSADPVSPFDVQTITVPTEYGDPTAWQSFAAAGYRYSAPAFHGLTTTVEFVEGGYQQEQWGTSGKSPYILTHAASDPNVYFDVRSIGFVNFPGAGFPGDLAPMSIVSLSPFIYAATALYSIDFEQHPGWRADFIDQPHFDGKPIPPSYYSKTVEELLALFTPVTKQFPDNPAQFLALDQSPELYTHPTLDRLVADAGNDPILLINRVINEIELSDFVGYNENGSAGEKSINLGGVRRNAYGVWMEKQGSPTEQCTLLVYLLRKAGVPAAYCTAAHNELTMLDLRMSQLFGMQLHGAPDFVGNPTVPHIIPTNYPWVAAYIDGQWRHIFPWLKDYENKEGFNLNEMLPPGYNNGHLLVRKYLTRDPLLLSMSADADNFGALFPKFLEKSLMDNHPGISSDQVGLTRKLRRQYFSRLQDLPQPWAVTEVTGPITLRESIGSTPLAFDTISVDIWSNANPSKRITVNDLRACDLHSRRFVLRTEKTGINAHNLILSLGEYRPGAGATGNFTGPTMREKQVKSITLDGSDDQISVKMIYRAHRTLPAGFQPPAHADAFFGLTEGLYFEDTRPFRKGDVGVLSFNFGRVTSEMIDAGMQAVADEQRRLVEIPGYIPDDDVIQGGVLNVMGLSYHKEFGDFRAQYEGWSKLRNFSFYSQGIMRLGARRDASGNLPNGGDIDPISPIIDVPIYRGAWAGNGTARPDLQMPEPMARWEPLIVTALEGSSQEHATADRYWKGTGAASTVRLLHNAQTAGLGVVEINADNFVAVGNTVYQGQTLSAWLGTSTWGDIVNAMTDTATGRFHYAFATPGPINAAAGTYRGLGTFIFERKGFAAYISGNLNGGFGKPNPSGSMQKPNYANVNLGYNAQGKPVVAVTQTTTPSSLVTPASVTNSNKGLTLQQLQNGVAVNGATQELFFNQQATLLGTANSTPAVYQKTENVGAATQPSWYKNAINMVADPVNTVTGELHDDEVDLVLPGAIPLAVRRNYGSQQLADGDFGWGWKWSFVPYLVISEGGGTIYASELDGASIAYVRDGTNLNLWTVNLAKNPRLANLDGNSAGSVSNPFTAKITHTTEAGQEIYTLAAADGSQRRYKVQTFPITSLGVSRARPYLEKWSDSSSNYLSFTFGSDPSTTDYGKVRRVESSCGQFLVVSYDFYGRIHEVLTRDNRRVLYDYDFLGDLRTVTRPDNTTFRYDYQKETVVVGGQNESVSTHLLELITKPEGRQLKNVFNNDRTVKEQWATVGTDLALVKNASFDRFVTLNAVTGHANGYVNIKDAYNRVTRYDIQDSQTVRITHPNTDTNTVADTEEFNFYTDSDPRPGAYPRSLAWSKDRRGLLTYLKYSLLGDVTETKIVGDITGDGVADEAITTRTYTALHLPDEIVHPNGHREKFDYEDAANPYFWTRHEWFVGATKISEAKRVFGARSQGAILAKGLLVDAYRAFGSVDEAKVSYDYNATGFKTLTTRFSGTTDPNVIVHHVPNYRDEEIERTDVAGRKWVFFRDDIGRPTGEERFDETGKLVWWQFTYYNGNGEVEWEDGAQYDPEDYIWRKFDGHGRPKERVQWRTDAKSTGDGMLAPLGDRLYSTTFYQHDFFNNLVKITDPRGNVTRQDFSNVGWMLTRRFYTGDEATGTLTASESWTYNPSGDVATHTDVLGGTTTNLQTALGQPKQITHPDGAVDGFRYYIDGRTERQILPNGNYWQTIFDDVARSETHVLHKQTGEIIKSDSRVRDRRGNILQDTDADNFAVNRTFDDLDRPKTETGPPLTISSEQQSKTWNYDASGILTVETNAKGESVEMVRDIVGRTTRTTVKTSTGGIVRQTLHNFTANHAGETIVEGGGATTNSTSVWRDNFGSLAIEKRGSASARIVFSDEAGNPLRSYDENGKLTIRNFDRFNRTSAMQEPETTVQFFDRNAQGHIRKRSLPGGIEAISTVNSAGQETLRELHLTSDPGTYFINRLTFTYYPAGHAWVGLLKTITDLRGVVQTCSYDEQRRLYQIVATGPEPQQNQTLTYGHNNRNDLTSIELSYPDAATGPATLVQRQFDGYRQLFDEKVFVGAVLAANPRSFFDKTGRRSELNAGGGHGAIADFNYRADGRMTQVSTDGKTYSFGFGTDGLLYSRGTPFFTESIPARNDRGLIEERNVTVAASVVLHEDPAWEAHSLLDTYTYQRTGEPQFTLDYQYTDRYKLLSEPFAKSNGTLGTLQCEFDSGGLGGLGARTRQTVSGSYDFHATQQSVYGRTITETTTDASRTITGTGNAFGALRVSLRLDGVSLGLAALNSTTGNWSLPLTVQPGLHALNAVALHPSGAFTAAATNSFSVQGAADTIGSGYDWLGNVSFLQRASGVRTDTKWDAFGHLTSVTELSPTYDGLNQKAVFDGLGRRLRVTTTPVHANVADAKAAIVEDSIFDPLVEFLEIAVAVNGVRTWKVHGPDLSGSYGGAQGIGGLLATVGESNGQTFGIISDLFGNCPGWTDGTSVTWNPCRVGAYGPLPGYFSKPLSPDTPLREAVVWRGRRVDATGFVNMGARLYDPRAGRFISTDPAGHDGSLTLYDYANGDPVNYCDPDGRFGKRVVTGKATIDDLQTGLDIAGLVPGVGEFADLANAGIYAIKGDKVNTALSLASAIPIAGWAATGGKYVNKIDKVVEAEQTLKRIENAAEASAKGGVVVDQYALKAVEDGFYPVMKRGFAEPQGEAFLKAGDVWKYGTTKNPATRYSQSFLDELGLRYEPEFKGTLPEALSAEKQKILNYLDESGVLPSGNKIIK